MGVLGIVVAKQRFTTAGVELAGEMPEKAQIYIRLLGAKERDQGVIGLATRKPSVSNRTLALRLTRTAARTNSLSLRQEPLRTTRKLGSPSWSHADPSVGATL